MNKRKKKSFLFGYFDLSFIPLLVLLWANPVQADIPVPFASYLGHAGGGWAQSCASSSLQQSMRCNVQNWMQIYKGWICPIPGTTVWDAYNNRYAYWMSQCKKGGASASGGVVARGVCPTGTTQVAGKPECSGNVYYVTAPPAPPRDKDPGKPCPCVGDPVNPSTGGEFQSETDVTVEAPIGKLEFSRYYNSLDTGKTALGIAWRHSYSRRLEFESNTEYLPYAPSSSAVYTTASAACLTGWNDLVAKRPDLAGPGPTWSNNICSIVRDGRVIPLPVFGPTPAAMPQMTVALRAVRDDGRILNYAVNGSPTWTITPEDSVTAKVETTLGGYRLTENDGTIEDYDASGRVVKITKRGGGVVTLSYTSGRLETVANDFGHSLSLSYDVAGNLSSVTAPDSSVTSYSYDSALRLSSVQRPDALNRTYLYESPGWPAGLTGIVDERGLRAFTWVYDNKGRVLSEQNGTGITTFSYGQGATIVSEPLGSVRTFNFVNIGSQRYSTGVTGTPCASCGYSASITYDAAGYVASRTDYNGTVTQFTNDPIRGIPLQIVEAAGTPQQRVTSTTWHPTFALPVTVVQENRERSYVYDGVTASLLSATTKDLSTGATQTTSYTYDPTTHHLIQIDGARTDVSDITTMSYYQCSSGAECGQIQSITNAEGHVTTFNSYDANGRPLSITEPSGAAVTLVWSARGQLLSRTMQGETTSYEYDGAGKATKITLPDLSFLEFSYDISHRLIGITDQLGNRIQYTLDAVGNTTKEDIYDPANQLRKTRSKVYDALGHLRELHGGNGQLIAYAYDSQDNLLQDTVSGLYTTLRQRDALGRLEQEIDAAGGVTTFGRNALDHLTSVTDPRGLVTNYTVNAFGNVTQLSSPDTGITSSTFDSAGNIKSRTDAKGQTTTYSYDALNRLTQAAYPGGNTVIYSYDQGTYGKGRLTNVTDASGNTAWTYDAHGRVLSKTQVTGGQTLTTTYAYDSAGRLTSQTLPSGKVVGLTWSGQHVTGVTLNGQPLASNIASEPFGPASQWDFANGQQVVRSYDLSGRMSSHSLGSLGYDQADRIVGLSHGGLSFLGSSKTYGYDDLDRLTSYSGAGASIGYTYDGNDNRLQQTSSVGTATSTIDSASNRILSLVSGAGTRSFQYDDNGSVLSDGLSSFSYDTAGRLSSANGTSYAYNGLGQRTVKTASGTNTLFSYDEQGRLQGEYNAAGIPIQETVWLGNTPIAVLKPGGTYYVHADHLNTPRQIDDQSGDTVWVWDTITFGASPPDEDPQSSGTPFVYNLRHPGQYYDAESGLFQNWHRDYNPGLGRYIESDPIGLEGGLNTYAYVKSNPISYVDSTGLNPALGAAGGFAVAGPPGAAIGGLIGLGVAYYGGQYIGDQIASAMYNRPPGVWPGDAGADEWGRRNDLGAKEGRRRFHDIKRGNRGKPGSKAGDNCSVDPSNGDVYDGLGDYIGNLGEGH